MFDKQLRTDLLRGVNSLVKPHGFRLQKSKDRFVRTTAASGDTHLFYLVMLDGERAYRVSPQVGVRLKAIERIFHQTSGFEPQYQADTASIGSDIWRIQGVESYVEIASSDELPRATEELYHLFTSFALPYFDRYSSVDAIDHALNDRPEQPCSHRIMDYLRAATGTIAAKLNKRANYNQLVASYRSHMAHFSKWFYLPRYESLLNYLEDAHVADTLDNGS